MNIQLPRLNRTTVALRDSIAMENAKTYSELAYVCEYIEARHAVGGISDQEREAYEQEKERHLNRVLAGVLA